jgi:hypothetical protein
MKAEELRIGNFVNTGNFHLPRYRGIYKIEESWFKWASKFQPIPLDEDWFLKCKSNSIFNNGFTYKKTITGRFEIYVEMSLITVIEFVHELQNLNFALLGEDVVFDHES